MLCNNCREKVEICRLICPVCKKNNPSGLTCEKCRGKYSSSSLLALYRYNGLAKDLVHKFKFEDMTALAGLFADDLIKRYNKRLCSFDLITCMPTSFARKLHRGYNQSEILAKQLSLRLNIPFRGTLSTTHRIPQSEIEDEQDRANNIKGKIKAKIHLDDERVLLVDDVFTTGSSIKEAAKVLIRTGAKSVDAVVIAIAK